MCLAGSLGRKSQQLRSSYNCHYVQMDSGKTLKTKFLPIGLLVCGWMMGMMWSTLGYHKGISLKHKLNIVNFSLGMYLQVLKPSSMFSVRTDHSLTITQAFDAVLTIEVCCFTMLSSHFLGVLGQVDSFCQRLLDGKPRVLIVLSKRKPLLQISFNI